MKTAYTKTYQKPAALVALLKQRGMEIDDETKAESYLKRIDDRPRSHGLPRKLAGRAALEVRILTKGQNLFLTE